VLQDINPRIPPSAIEDAVRKIILTEITSIIKDVRRPDVPIIY